MKVEKNKVVIANKRRVKAFPTLGCKVQHLKSKKAYESTKIS